MAFLKELALTQYDYILYSKAEDDSKAQSPQT
jgi:hypothetical protein